MSRKIKITPEYDKRQKELLKLVKKSAECERDFNQKTVSRKRDLAKILFYFPKISLLLKDCNLYSVLWEMKEKLRNV